MSGNKLASFLKWPGGKRWLISRHIDIIPINYRHYYEPFIGGGSVYFNLLPSNATISDINDGLMNLYNVMRDNPDQLKQVLEVHQTKHNKEYYYQIREYEPEEALEKAGRFLYLNRTCFNGMYRVNQQGKFNVPIGTKTDFTYDLNRFVDYSLALQKAEILVSDFGCMIQKAEEQDLVFADPPYTIAHNQNSFIKYNEKLFTWADQERLLKELYYAKKRGAIIISTNANYGDISKMYLEHNFYVTVIERYSTIAGKTTKRRMTEELLITSFPIEKN